jgi:hypothetical protein
MSLQTWNFRAVRDGKIDNSLLPSFPFIHKNLRSKPALRRLKQEESEFVVSLGYLVRPCLKKTNLPQPLQQ